MHVTQTFKVMIVYENMAGACRAKEMAQRLATELESRCETWKFELLAHPRLREYAAIEAAEADMIIIAARGGYPLPDHIKGWVETWLPQRKDGPTILVALLDEELEEDREERSGTDSELLPANFDYLRQVAARGGMDFLSNLDPVPSPAASELNETAGFERPAFSDETILQRRRYEEAHARQQCHAI